MAGPNLDEIEEKILQRKMNKVVDHAIGHIKAGRFELAVNILTAALNKDKEARRKGDS